MMAADFPIADKGIHQCFKNLPLKIAVTGQSGSGKSSFINALRGLDEDDDGAAPTGVTETTMEVKSYPHPHFPNVTLWDLPGVGTPNFPTQNYLELVEFERFDFFVIVSADRFTENDVKLAKEIKTMKKLFYFVRSKIDLDLQNERRKRNYCEEKAMEKIRRACTEGLESQELESQVFLLSSHNPSLFDFPNFLQTIEKELPQRKADALLDIMFIHCQEIIEKKKKALQGKIKWLAMISAGAAIVPGLSAAVDIALITAAVKHYIFAFRLNTSSLEKLAVERGTTFEHLTSILKCPASAKETTMELLETVWTQYNNSDSIMGAIAWRWFPIIGLPIGMRLSFKTIYAILENFLNLLAEDAESAYIGALVLENEK